MTSVTYFAYGSNLLFARLHARCASIRRLGVARLDGHRLHFNKPGGDASGKCGIEAVDDDSHVLGVLYRMHGKIRKARYSTGSRVWATDTWTDRCESVVMSGPVSCFTYYPTVHSDGLPPWDWYKAFVLGGRWRTAFPTTT